MSSAKNHSSKKVTVCRVKLFPKAYPSFLHLKQLTSISTDRAKEWERRKKIYTVMSNPYLKCQYQKTKAMPQLHICPVNIFWPAEGRGPAAKKARFPISSRSVKAEQQHEPIYKLPLSLFE